MLCAVKVRVHFPAIDEIRKFHFLVSAKSREEAIVMVQGNSYFDKDAIVSICAHELRRTSMMSISPEMYDELINH